ncbi:MAG TPA: hypothetical protein VNB90_01315 [Cytophagaceae bacterium]|jgi:hypothetical protein|nr:hypothetical protein [Cytophagaceae bacterium]
MRKLILILNVLLWSCTNADIKDDHKKVIDDLKVKDNIINVKVKKVELFFSELEETINPGRKYTVQLLPEDPMDSIARIDFTSKNVFYKKYRDPSIVSFYMPLETAEEDSVLGLKYLVIRKNKTKFIIDHILENSNVTDTVTGIEERKYYKVEESMRQQIARKLFAELLKKK